MTNAWKNPTREESFETIDDLRIFLRSHMPAKQPRAVVVICHGFNSHSGQYGWVASQLAQAGCAVYALDLRGHGRSEGRRFYVEDVEEYVADVEGAVNIARSRHPNLPIFLLGHSAGGVVSCIYALEHPHELAGLICESFAFQVPASGVALTAIKGLSHIAPYVGVLKLKNGDFTRDLTALAELESDPLTANEKQPAATVAALVRADERLQDSFADITLPVLILHGTEDKATISQGSQFFYAAVGSKDKVIKLYQGYYHDLLNDKGKEMVLGDITAWIADHLGSRKSKPPRDPEIFAPGA